MSSTSHDRERGVDRQDQRHDPGHVRRRRGRAVEGGDVVPAAVAGRARDVGGVDVHAGGDHVDLRPEVRAPPAFAVEARLALALVPLVARADGEEPPDRRRETGRVDDAEGVAVPGRGRDRAASPAPSARLRVRERIGDDRARPDPVRVRQHVRAAVDRLADPVGDLRRRRVPEPAADALRDPDREDLALRGDAGAALPVVGLRARDARAARAVPVRRQRRRVVVAGVGVVPRGLVDEVLVRQVAALVDDRDGDSRRAHRDVPRLRRLDLLQPPLGGVAGIGRRRRRPGERRGRVGERRVVVDLDQLGWERWRLGRGHRRAVLEPALLRAGSHVDEVRLRELDQVALVQLVCLRDRVTVAPAPRADPCRAPGSPPA